MAKVFCPVCQGQVEGQPSGKNFVVAVHEMKIEDLPAEECAGSESTVGPESLVEKAA